MNSTIRHIATVILSLSSALAQSPAPPAEPVPAWLSFTEAQRPPQQVVIVEATPSVIRYKASAESAEIQSLERANLQAVYFFEPQIYHDAMIAYRARKYAEAKDMFAESKRRYQNTSVLPDNYASLSAFYELECFRRMGDLAGLAKALEGFRKDALTRENHHSQIALYVFWDAVRTKSWERIVALAEERRNDRIPSSQRAQIAYCTAMAHEQLGQSVRALNAYNMAMVADIGASEEIAGQAACAVMRLHLADPDVQRAIQAWGSAEEITTSRGFRNLQEAAAVAVLYELTLGGGKALPEEFRSLPTFKAVAPFPER